MDMLTFAYIYQTITQISYHTRLVSGFLREDHLSYIQGVRHHVDIYSIHEMRLWKNRYVSFFLQEQQFIDTDLD